jgi:molecular chaperone DnaK
VVAFVPSGERLVGSAARERRLRDPKNTIYSSKRIIGQSWFSMRTRKFIKQYPFELVDKDGSPAFQTRGGALTATEIATVIVSALSERAAISPEGHGATVCVPAGFGRDQRAATARAVQAAGYAEVRTVDEPIATALAYAHEGRLGSGRVAVYDFGGGTFDLAVLDCSARPLRVLAHGGDASIGGDDIDRALAGAVAREVLERAHWDLRTERTVFARLVTECELAKIRLCAERETRIPLDEVDPAASLDHCEIVLTNERLAKLSTELVRGTFVTCDSVLHDARIQTKEIDAVLLAGGTTKLPHVREGVRKYFDREPQSDVDPLAVVAIGASVAPETT